MIFEISHSTVNVVEIAWITINVEFEGKNYELEFDTNEEPSDGYFCRVEFATEESVELANFIGFEITEDFKSELYHKFGEYSNEKR